MTLQEAENIIQNLREGKEYSLPDKITSHFKNFWGCEFLSCKLSFNKGQGYEAHLSYKASEMGHGLFEGSLFEKFSREELINVLLEFDKSELGSF